MFCETQRVLSCRVIAIDGLSYKAMSDCRLHETVPEARI